MKAAVIEHQGGIDSLSYREWPDPIPGPNDVILAVEAIGLNHLDIFVRRGMPGFAVKTPFISGGDIAGVIDRLGENVRGWRVGERVLVNPITDEGMIGEQIQGGMAELARVPAACLVRLPDEVDFITAAAIPINFGTALRMLETIGRLGNGELVLILGASGGVGTACIQLSRRMGATVIAVTRGPERGPALSNLGAHHVIDGAAEDFSAAAWRISGRRGVDLAVNFTGGETWVPTLRALKRRGRLVTCGATESFDPKTDIRYIWTRELQILGSDGYSQSDIERAVELVRDSEVTPVIHKVFHLSAVQEAHRMLESRTVVGKIVLTPSLLPGQGAR
jgi:alcohol dehydrogenase